MYLSLNARRGIFVAVTVALPYTAAALDLAEYVGLVNHCPDSSVQRALLTRPNNPLRFQTIEHALGDATHLDSYSVEIRALPVLPGTSTRATPDGLLQYLRNRLPHFLRSDEGAWQFLDESDSAKWNSGGYSGSTFRYVRSTDDHVPSDGALAVVSGIATEGGTSRWTLTSVSRLSGAGGLWTGTREFSVRTSGGRVLIESRGALRQTDQGAPSTASGALLASMDRSLRSWQKNVQAFVEQSGGSAKTLAADVVKVSWPSMSKAGNTASGCRWHKGALGSDMNAASARVALALLTESDPTGVKGAIAATTLNALRTAGLFESKAAILEEARQVADRALRARSPRDLQLLAESEIGRKFGLHRTLPSFDPSTLKYLNPATLAGERTITGQLVDGASHLRPQVISKTLLEKTGLDVSEGHLVELVGVVAGLRSAPTKEAFLSLVSDRTTRDGIAQVAAVMEDPRKHSVQSLATAADILVNTSTAKVTSRVNELSSMVSRVGLIPDALSPPMLRALFEDNMAANGLVGTGRALSLLAVFDKNLSESVNSSVQLVSAGMEAHKGASLLVSGITGGSFIAALGVLNGAGLLGNAFGGGQDNTKELMKAIAELTKMIQRQFAQINGRLTAIEATLGRIEDELRRVHQLQAITLDNVTTINRNVLGLYGRLDKLETSLLTAMVSRDADKCLNYVLYNDGDEPARKEFRDCLTAFMQKALIDLPQVTVDADDVERAVVRNFSPLSLNDATLRSAAGWLVAEAEGRAFGDAALLAASGEEQNSKNFSSSRLAIEAGNALHAMIRRYGKKFIAPTEVEDYVRINQIEKIISRLKSVEAYRRSVAGDESVRLPRLVRMVSAYGASHEAFIDSLTKYRLEAIVNYAVPTALKSRWDFGGELRRCEDGTRLGTLEAGTLDKTVLADYALSSGGYYWSSVEGTPTKKPILEPLTVCLVNMTYRQRFVEHWFRAHSIAATYQVRLYGVTLGSLDVKVPGYVRTPFGSLKYFQGRPTDAEVLPYTFAPLHSQLSAFFNNESNRDVLKGHLVKALANSEQPLAQLWNAAAFGTAMAEQAFSERFANSAVKVDSSLAMLRGHLSVAFPATYAAHGRLRSRLEGDHIVRSPDSASFRALGVCATRLKDFLTDEMLKQHDATSAPPAELVDRLCPGMASRAMLSAESLKEMGGRFRGVPEDLLGVLSSTNWDAETDFPEGNAVKAAARLQAFADDGASSRFYEN